MKLPLYIIIIAAIAATLFVGCTTTSRDLDATGIITEKHHDEAVLYVYDLGASGRTEILKPEAFWLKLRDQSGNTITVHMDTETDIEAWRLLEVGDTWPQI